MDLTNEQLVEVVTKEVMKLISREKEIGCFGGNPKLPVAALIGDESLVPDSFKRLYNFRPLDKGGFEFDKLFLTELNNVELADIALGRNTRAVQCAVLSALLDGKEVWLLEDALRFRAAVSPSARALKETYEGYVRTIISYGVKLFNGKTSLNKHTAAPKPDKKLPEGVITEAVARVLTDKSGEDKIIELKKGSILTPSARDVFSDAGKKIILV